MVQAGDDTATAQNDVVIPLRPDPHPKDRTGAERQARFRQNHRRNGGREKTRRNNKNRRPGAPTVTSEPAHFDAPPIAPTVTQPQVEEVTPSARETTPKWRNTMSPKQRDVRQPRYASVPLVVIAYGFFALGVSINIWNAWSAGPIANCN